MQPPEHLVKKGDFQETNGDVTLGLELLEDGGFRIDGLEFKDQELRPLKLQGLEIERATSPESVLTVKKKHIARRFVFLEGRWFGQAASNPDAAFFAAHSKAPSGPSANGGSENRRNMAQPQSGTAPTVPNPELLECEPELINKILFERHYLINGLLDGQDLELFARYALHFKALAPVDAKCGQSRKRAGGTLGIHSLCSESILATVR